MNIGLPSGIGDCSWAISKLVHVKDDISAFTIADGWPHRTHDYIQLCGWPRAEYGPFTYQTITTFMNVNQLWPNPTWAQLKTLDGAGAVLVAPNEWLERGKRLEDWMPDLPTEFHYPLATTAEDAERAAKLLRDLPHPSIGISCASYRGSEAWKTWGRVEWCEFLRRLQVEGWNPILIGGFWDDLTSTVADELGLPDLVGKTTVGQMVEVLKLLDSFITYSSGLNVTRTVLDKPVMALWPDFQEALSTSWAPPDMLESGRYVARLWRPVDEVWPTAKRFLRLCDDERSRGNGVSVAGFLNDTAERSA